MEAGNRFGLIFNGRNYVEQVRRLQYQPHISAGPEQFQVRTSALEGHKCVHDGADARRIQLRDIGQIYQHLAVAVFNQQS